MGGSRIPISNSQRIALRQYYRTAHPKPTHAALKTWFKSQFSHEISQSIISRSLSDSFAYLDVCVASAPVYRARNCQWPWMEILLTEWLQEAESQSGNVSNDVVARKAKELWEQSNESQGLATPKFSPGWIVKFKRRHRLRLQSAPDQRGVLVPPSTADEHSFPKSHGNFAIRPKTPTGLVPTHSNTGIISSNNNTSLDSGNPMSTRLTFSSDHLIHLIQHNAYRAVMSNKDLVLSKALVLWGSDVSSPIEQYATRLCGGLSVIHPVIDQLLPSSLYPTKLQMECAHTGWINMFPFPNFRDNLIKKGVDFIPENLCRDLFGDVFPTYFESLSNGESVPDFCGIPLVFSSSAETNGTVTQEFEDEDDYTAGRKCLINWGDPWKVESWEVTPGFLQNWGWALEGCPEMIEASNRWRASRNEKLITWR